mgnify:CR=1 FL=1
MVSVGGSSVTHRSELEKAQVDRIQFFYFIAFPLALSFLCFFFYIFRPGKLNKEKNESNQYDDNEDIQEKIRYISFLNELKEYVLQNIKQNETNDEIRINIETQQLEEKPVRIS